MPPRRARTMRRWRGGVEPRPPHGSGNRRPSGRASRRWPTAGSRPRGSPAWHGRPAVRPPWRGSRARSRSPAAPARERDRCVEGSWPIAPRRARLSCWRNRSWRRDAGRPKFTPRRKRPRAATPPHYTGSAAPGCEKAARDVSLIARRQPETDRPWRRAPAITACARSGAASHFVLETGGSRRHLTPEEAPTSPKRSGPGASPERTRIHE